MYRTDHNFERIVDSFAWIGEDETGRPARRRPGRNTVRRRAIRESMEAGR
jgi:hypothetical protein